MNELIELLNPGPQLSFIQGVTTRALRHRDVTPLLERGTLKTQQPPPPAPFSRSHLLKSYFKDKAEVVERSCIGSTLQRSIQHALPFFIRYLLRQDKCLDRCNTSPLNRTDGTKVSLSLCPDKINMN